MWLRRLDASGRSGAQGLERVHRELDDAVRRPCARQGVPLADEHAQLVQRGTRRDVATVRLRQPVVFRRRQVFRRIRPVLANTTVVTGAAPSAVGSSATRTSMLPVLALKYDSTVLPSICRMLISPTRSGHSGVGGLSPAAAHRPALPARPVGEVCGCGAVENHRPGAVEVVGDDVHPAARESGRRDRVVVPTDLRLPAALVVRASRSEPGSVGQLPCAGSAFTNRDVCGLADPWRW